MGEDVKPFTGAAQLVKVLTQHFDGTSSGAACLVQERIEHATCELRFICCRDLAGGPTAVTKELVRMRLKHPQHNDETFMLTSHQTMTAAETQEVAFCGSAAAMQKAEQEAGRLADRWLHWLRDEGYGTPNSVRIDFLVSAKPAAARDAEPEVELWTMELCENGGSLCNISPAARAVSCLNNCIHGDGSGPPVAGFPMQLPVMKAIEPAPAPAATTGSWNNWKDTGGANAGNWKDTGGANAGNWKDTGGANAGGASYANSGSGSAPQQRYQQRGGGGRQQYQREQQDKQQQQLQLRSQRPLTRMLAKLGLDGNSGGRAILAAALALLFLWLRARRLR
jgi:hypothetical protein